MKDRYVFPKEMTATEVVMNTPSFYPESKIVWECSGQCRFEIKTRPTVQKALHDHGDFMMVMRPRLELR